jgi:hypothetical protein
MGFVPKHKIHRNQHEIQIVLKLSGTMQANKGRGRDSVNVG